MKTKIFGNGAWLAGVALALALFSMCGEARALTVQVDYSGSLNSGNPDDAYSFSLSDHAKVDGLFSASGTFNYVSVYVKDGSGNVFGSGTATPHVSSPIGGVFPEDASFHIADLGPGNYFLSFVETYPFATNYSGHLSFSSIATVTPTPIPASLLMFTTALGGLGFLRWRRRETPAC